MDETKVTPQDEAVLMEFYRDEAELNRVIIFLKLMGPAAAG